MTIPSDHRLDSRRRSARGFTLVELMAVIAVIAILLGLGVPHFASALERRHLAGLAAQLETDLHFARSLAVARNEGVRVAFLQGPQSSCYVLHTGSAGACRCQPDGTAACASGAEALRTVALAPSTPVRLNANVGSKLIDGVRGTVTPTGTIRLASRSGPGLNVVVNIMGRVRACGPAHRRRAWRATRPADEPRHARPTARPTPDRPAADGSRRTVPRRHAAPAIFHIIDCSWLLPDPARDDTAPGDTPAASR